jgi:hypothetical protein
MTLKDHVLLIIYVLPPTVLCTPCAMSGLPKSASPPTQFDLKTMSAQSKPSHLLHHMMLLFGRQPCKIGRPSWLAKLEPTEVHYMLAPAPYLTLVL